MDVVDGTEDEVLAGAVVAGVEGWVEIDTLVEETLLSDDVDEMDEDSGEVSDMTVGTTSGVVLLPGRDTLGIGMLLVLDVVKGRSVVNGAVGVMVGSDEVVRVPLDGAVDVVSTGRGTTEAPDVLKVYEPVEMPVPVSVAVAAALDEASDDAALDRMPENADERVEDAAGSVATMLES